MLYVSRPHEFLIIIPKLFFLFFRVDFQFSYVVFFDKAVCLVAGEFSLVFPSHTYVENSPRF